MFGRLALLALLQFALAPARAESPGGSEFPFWPAAVRWSPKTPFKTCSPIDSAKPHGTATWDAQFTSCVYTLAYFDTCADDACVDAFSEASKNALNCSYDGKIGTAQEIETYRLQRCAAARKVASERYVPESSPSAPTCTSAQLAAWSALYTEGEDYNMCLKALTTTTSTRTCSEYCRRVFHDAVSDADECLFSNRAGNVTHHEWLKYHLVWCIEARGETIRADPLLYVKGTSAPVPTTPKPTKTTPAPTAAPSASSSGSGDDAGESEPTAKKTRKPTIEPSSSASEESGVSTDSSGPPIDIASSTQEEETTQTPIQSPPKPLSPNYGSTTNAAATPTLHVFAAATAVGGALLPLM